MGTVIKPSVGRVVWFRPNGSTAISHVNELDEAVPMAATVAYVHPDGRVNLTVSDHTGVQHATPHVLLVQEDEAKPEWGTIPFCAWMPFQMGQAAKTEELEKQLGEGKT